MEYNVLGKTGVLVSQLCFGTMSFGGDADAQTAGRMFRRCREAGINFFDCANNYNAGKAEEILGTLIRDCRDELIITTKFSNRTASDVNSLGASRRHVMLAVEQSLGRLKTDRIDLYFIHHYDPLTPIEETLRALDDLVRQGKVLYIGASNWAAWQITKALGISERDGLSRFECIQPMYSLVKRQAEVEILPMAQAESVGVISYSPVAGGFLSGKYARSRRPETGRIVDKALYRKRYSDPVYLDVAERFVEYAAGAGVHPVTLAVGWVLAHPAITAPIIGARNLEQLEPSLAAAELDMPPDLRAKISTFSVQPPAATDRLEEMLDSAYRFRNK